MESDATSPRNSEPTSLTESMQMVDLILSDNKIDRLDKIDKLEAILSAVTLLPSENEVSVTNKCSCNCHLGKNGSIAALFDPNSRVLSPTNRYESFNGDGDVVYKENHTNFGTQTLSTGDIVVTKIYFNENVE